MKKNNLPLSVVLTVCFICVFSCLENNEMKILNGDYIIFGSFSGYCEGEQCIEMFKLTNKKLFEDTNDHYPGENKFNFVELSNEKFEKVKDLMDHFPNDLLNQNDTTFGCPDCADQGGLFIQYAIGEDIKTWKIDQFKNSVPSYLHEFMDKINEKITVINSES